MRELGTFSDQEHAFRLACFLETQSIPVTVDHEDDQWVIFVRNDDDRESAQQIQQHFLENPDAAEYADAIRQAKQLRQKAQRRDTEVQRKQVDIRSRWSGVWWQSYPATTFMIFLCGLVVAVCTDWHSGKRAMLGLPVTCNNEESVLLNAMFIRDPRLIVSPDGEPVHTLEFADILQRGQVWRLVTPIFLHFNFLHILFNMMWLRDLGGAVEYVRGTRRFLLLVLVLAITSNLAEAIFSGPLVLFGGMSGVVFGLIGYVWMKGRTQPQLGIGLAPQQVVYSFLWMFLCIGGAFGPIANMAHAAGMAAGVLIGARQAILRRLLK